mgnify:CR=1 FL=1
MRRASEPPAAFAAFAAVSCSAGTMRGTSANDAGSFTSRSNPCTAATMNAGHTRSAVTASSGTRQIACSTLVRITVRRRSHRSTKLPPYGPQTMATSNSMTTMAAVARPEPVSMYTNAGSATASNQSPTLLTKPPPRTRRKSRLLHTLNDSLTVTARTLTHRRRRPRRNTTHGGLRAVGNPRLARSRTRSAYRNEFIYPAG